MKKVKLPKPDIFDILTVTGTISLSIGLWMIYHPAMFIMLGIGSIWLGFPRKGVK